MKQAVQWPLFLSVFLLEFCRAKDIYTLCRDAHSLQLQQLQTLCSSVQGLVNDYETDRFRRSSDSNDNILELLSDNSAKSDDRSVRMRRGSEKFFTPTRPGRGGGYIRFGRSAGSSGAASFNDYLTNSFASDKRSGSYMRFGKRSVDSLVDNASKRDHYIRFGRSVDAQSDDEADNVTKNVEKRDVDEKRFMRFGKADETASDEEKRFMRFGRDPLGDSYEDKRFMRFGRDPEDTDSLPDLTYEDLASLSLPEKKFMRFGRPSEDDSAEMDKKFMRFGKSTNEDIMKRFMRFGKRYPGDSSEEKRFMRFGKRDDTASDEEKRFMRFGKRAEGDSLEDKRFMRFGKRENTEEEGKEKRFMRFGKSLGGLEKRFMRFGKRDSADVLSADKKFMRFGKKDGAQ